MDYVIFLFERIPVWVKLTGFIVGLSIGILNACWGSIQQVQLFRRDYFAFELTRRGVVFGADLVAGILWVTVVWLVMGSLMGFLLAVLIYLTWPACLVAALGVGVIWGGVHYYIRRRKSRALR